MLFNNLPEKGCMVSRIEFVECANERGEWDGTVVPDPQRYSIVEENGEKLLLDSVEGRKISADELVQEMERVRNPMVLRNFSSKIPGEEGLAKYVDARRRKIPDSMEKEYVMNEDDQGEKFLADAYLMGAKEKGMKCAFATLDFRGFTELGQTLPGEQLSLIASVFARESGMLADMCGGFVLKYMGDGVVAYFTGPNVIGMSRNALFYGHALKSLIIGAINPALAEKGIPALKFGIACECGPVGVARIGSWYSRLHHDLIGAPLSMTFRIQALSRENDVLVGEEMASCLPKEWKSRISEIPVPDGWGLRKAEPQSPAEGAKKAEGEYKRKNSVLGKLGLLQKPEAKKPGFRVFRL